MKSEADLLTTLRSTRPVEPDGWAHSATARRIRASALISHGGTDNLVDLAGRPRRRRPAQVIGIASALVIGGGAAVAAVVFQADNPTVAGCYTSLSENADMTEISSARVAEVGAAQACAEVLAVVEPDVDTTHLVTCLNEFGGRGVFPVAAGTDASAACDSLGWQLER